MPKEEFYGFDATSASLTVRWGAEQPGVTIDGVEYDRSGINRLIAVLSKARDQTYGSDA